MCVWIMFIKRTIVYNFTLNFDVELLLHTVDSHKSFIMNVIITEYLCYELTDSKKTRYAY